MTEGKIFGGLEIPHREYMRFKFIGGTRDGRVQLLPADAMFVDTYHNDVLKDHYIRMDFDPVDDCWIMETF